MIIDFLKRFLQPPIIIASVIFGLILLTFTILTVNLAKIPATHPAQTTADLRVIAGPTSTPTSHPPTKTPVHTPTLPATPTLSSGELGIGAFVMIEGTGGIGLNIRSDPGVNASINFLGAETEVFQILEGPISADGYTWWFLVKPGEESRQGWAAQKFFNPIETLN